MLALMGVANDGAEATLVFDEVDAGIGGHTARAVGSQLRALADGRQVLCITHLPQIASLAARHFSIEKDSDGRAGAHDGPRARAPARSWPSSCACSAPMPTTWAPGATPGSCWRPRSQRRASRCQRRQRVLLQVDPRLHDYLLGAAPADQRDADRQAGSARPSPAGSAATGKPVRFQAT